MSWVFFCCINPDVNPASIKTSDIAINTIAKATTPNSSGVSNLFKAIVIKRNVSCLNKLPEISQITEVFDLLTKFLFT